MTALIRAELVGLRTLRSSYATPVLLVALAALIAAADLSSTGKKGHITPTQLREPVVAGAGLTIAVAFAIFAAMHVAGQYRHRTITQRLLACPRRRGTLVAQLLTYAILGLLLSSAALLAGLAIAQPVVAGKHLPLGLSAGVVAGVLLSVALFAMIGVSVAVITRSQPAAISVLVATFVAEKIIGGLIKGAGAYLPYGLLNPLLGMSGATISRGAAALILTGITAAIAFIAYVLLARRDVT
jgi:ABC-2 type transport system permease protein